MARLAVAGLHAALATLLFSGLGGLGCSSAPSLPDVVVITLDTFRADSLGLLGNTRGHTPNLDGFGERAAVFERAYTTMGTTFPAHASLFTGLYPKRHRVRFNGDSLDDSYVTLAEVLTEAGYATGAFVGHRGLLMTGGMRQGFGFMGESPDDEGVFRSGDVINKRALGWLRSVDPAKPHFLWVQHFDAHTPYEPTAYSQQAQAALQYSGEFSSEVDDLQLLRPDLDPDDRSLAALRALYDGGIRRVDEQVGELLDAIDATGRPTIVLIVADHGESLGEHGDYLHGHLLWEEVIQVPMLLRAEGLTPQIVTETVTIVDVMATLLELIGIDDDVARDGASLLSLLQGASRPATPAFIEVRTVQGGDWSTTARQSSIAAVSGDAKVAGAGAELRRWQLAPGSKEQAVVAADASSPAIYGTLEESVARYREDWALPETGEISDSTRRELEELGYIQ